MGRKVVDGYTESDGTVNDKLVSKTGQLKPGVEANYSFDSAGTTISPFVKTQFVYDFWDRINDDNIAGIVGGGVRLSSAETGFSGSLEGETQVGRSDYSEYTINGLLAYSFALNGDNKTVTPFVQTNFTGDGRLYKAGFDYRDSTSDMVLSFDMTHTPPTNMTQSNNAGSANLQYKF